MTDRELMQQALEALVLSTPEPRENDDDYCETGWKEHRAAIRALRERLAQPEQEPVGTLTISHYKGNLENYDFDYVGTLPDGTYSLYITPPQRKPLTDEAIWLEYQRFWPFHPAEEPTLAKDIVKFARAIEAKLKEKNA